MQGTLSHRAVGFADLCKPPTGERFRGSHLPVADLIPEAYADFAAPIFAGFANPGLTTREADVAEAIWQAATDGSDRLHYPAGPDAVALAEAA